MISITKLIETIEEIANPLGHELKHPHMQNKHIVVCRLLEKMIPNSLVTTFGLSQRVGEIIVHYIQTDNGMPNTAFISSSQEFSHLVDNSSFLSLASFLGIFNDDDDDNTINLTDDVVTLLLDCKVMHNAPWSQLAPLGVSDNLHRLSFVDFLIDMISAYLSCSTMLDTPTAILVGSHVYDNVISKLPHFEPIKTSGDYTLFNGCMLGKLSGLNVFVTTTDYAANSVTMFFFDHTKKDQGYVNKSSFKLASYIIPL